MGLFDKFIGKQEAQPQTIPARSLLAPPKTAQPLMPMSPQAAPQPQAIRPEPMPVEAPAPVMPEPEPQMYPPAPEPAEPRVRIVEDRQVFMSSPEEAPVFVKLKRYEDLLGHVAEMKAVSLNMRALLQIIAGARSIESSAISELEKQVGVIDDTNDGLDAILVKEEPVKKRVQEAKFAERKMQKTPEVDSLEDRVRRLKEEIKSMSR